MRYMFYRLLKLMWGNKKIYGLIVLEMAVGVTIFVVCLNVMLTNRDILLEHQKVMAESPTVIYYNTSNKDFDSEPELAVRYQDYQYLEEQFGNSVDLYYTAYYDASIGLFLYGQVSELSNINFLFMNDTMFESIFSFERQPDRLYVGSRAADLLSKAADMDNYNLVCWGYGEEEDPDRFSQEKVNVVCRCFLVKDGKIQLSQGHTLGYEPIPNEETTPYIDRLSFTQYMDPEDGARLYIEDCIIGTVDMLPYISREYYPFDFILQAKYREDAQDPSVIPTLVNWLNRERGTAGYKFNLTDKALSMEKYSSEMNARIFKYMIVSLAIVAIVLIGTVGILLVILSQRKKSMAVAYCCGATPWKSFLELYGEISSVFLAGGILGLALSGGITPRLSAVESAADFYPVNIVFVILFCLAAALLCCGAALAGVDNKDPVKNLKEL